MGDLCVCGDRGLVCIVDITHVMIPANQGRIAIGFNPGTTTGTGKRKTCTT
jgi:hypothetical protein